MTLSPPEPAPARDRPQAPPYVDWWDWYVTKSGELHQGMHVLFNGPTQCGKTTLCRYLAALRDYVVVLGTKPKDPSLDEYVNEGYLRIDHWPTNPGEWRHVLRKGEELWRPGQVRLLLWPKIRTRTELRSWRHEYLACIEGIFVDGSWTLVADEGIWLGSREGLNLGTPLSDLAYGSASNRVSLYLLAQRPAGIPRIIWSSVAAAELFHSGVTNDIRELASLGTYPPRDVARALQSLEGHQFLDLPTRGRATWAISELRF